MFLMINISPFLQLKQTMISIIRRDLNGYNKEHSVSLEDIHGDYARSVRFKMIHTYSIYI